MKFTLAFLIIIPIIGVSETYRILAIFPLPGKSHMVVYERLMQMLVEKGHEVDVVSHFPLKKPVLRYNEINIQGSLDAFENVSIPDLLTRISNYYKTVRLTVVQNGLDICKAILNLPIVKELRNTRTKYDLVVTEIFGCDCMLGFGYLFKVPVISFITSISFPWAGDRIGNIDNPSYIPNYFLPYSDKMSLMERVKNAVMFFGTKLQYGITESEGNILVREFFGPNTPDIYVLAKNTSLIIVNSHFSFNFPRPTVPNFIEVAGLHIQPPKPLSKYFRDLLDVTSKYKGVIYFSMGSMAATESLPFEKLKGILDAFKELPYKILWRAYKGNLPKNLEISSNIHFESWMPQIDLLCHPNVKLLISHAGLLGLQESTYCGVPSLGIPLFADHDINMKTVEVKGYGITVNYDNITKESILWGAKTLLEDPSYKANVKRASQLFRDRPMSALDTTIYWIEYVIRHNGAPHLRTVGADLHWYQYFLVDVVVVLLVMLVLLVTLICCAILYLLRLIRPEVKPTVKPKSD